MKLTTGFLTLRLDELGRGLFGIAADLADHDDGIGLGIGLEERERVHEVGADDGIAADADGRALPHAQLRDLVYRLVGQGSGARDDADASRTVDVARHDADLAFARRDDARTVGADEARLLAFQIAPRGHHVPRGNALGDADDERDAGVGGFHDGVGGKRRRHKDDGRVGAGRAQPRRPRC